MLRPLRAPCALLFVASAVFVAASSLSSQEQTPPVFRGGTTFVSVDVYPRRNGAFVEGLTAADFQVFEDGRPQKVATFELLRFEINPVDSARRDPSSVAASEREAADPKNRLFVVYLDPYHTRREHSRSVAAPVIGFLQRTIGATDLFGVMTPDIPARQLTFGRRTDTIEAELTRHGDWGVQDQSPWLGRTPDEDRLMMCAATLFPANTQTNQILVKLYREDRLYTSLEELVLRLRDLREERKNVILVSEGWVPEPEIPTLLADITRPTVPKVGISRGGKLVMGDPSALNPDDSKCRADITRLASIDFPSRFRQLVTDAGRGNVSFFPVAAGGLSPWGAGGIETLRTLAEANDGYAAVNTNDIAGGLRRIADRLSAYYLLGYYSTNEARDSRFRKIEVKINQPNVTVAARRGYFAVSPDRREVVRPSSAYAATTPQPIVDAIATLGRLDSSGELFGSATRSGDGIDVVLELPSGQLDNGAWPRGTDLTLTITEASAAIAKANTRFDPGVRSVLVHVPIAAGSRGPWRVNARGGDENRTVEGAFDVVAASGSQLGAPRVFRGAASTRIPLQPVAELKFRRTERLHVEWPVLKMAVDRSARLLDQRGQPLTTPVVVSQSEGADGQQRVAIDLTLNSLALGNYVLEVTVGTGPDQERALLAFRVGG